MAIALNKKTVTIIGDVNAGKSSFFNYLINEEKSIISDKKGTTTDPVVKFFELEDFGPIRLVDTAGLNDLSSLGKKRNNKTLTEAKNSDLIIYLISSEKLLKNNIKNDIEKIKQTDYLKNKKVIFIISKADLLKNNTNFDYPLFSIKNSSKNYFYSLIKDNLKKDDEESLLKGLLKKNETALLVIPIDSQAPQKRLILPQVQTIREIIDIKATSIISSVNNCLDNIKKYKPDLVIVDSKVFKEVVSIIPEDVKITTFSIIFARQKGNIKLFIEGAKHINKLNDGDNILISESCSHTKNHEDIGQVLIPNLIRAKLNKNFNFTFSNGYMPDDIKNFDLIIQCGGCMMSKENMVQRINKAIENNIAITNYGIIISYLNGELKRAVY